MHFSQFNFENDAWFWGLLAIPVALILYRLLSKEIVRFKLLERLADRNLLPHLIKNHKYSETKALNRHSLWALAWLCGIVAMAGPRWNYTDVQVFKPAQDMVILLDLSQSMNAQDVKPSRIARAREEIQDLLDLNRGATIGLVAYAAVPHMVTPLTDDMKTIRNLLPALDTSLVTIQGNSLKPAMEMASRMLNSEPGKNKSILVISDGSFAENDYSDLAKAAGNAAIYTMGVGTMEGAPVPDGNGGWMKDESGKMVISRLQAKRLQLLSTAGHGLYVEANYTDSDTRAILSHINVVNESTQTAKITTRVWEERYYIPAIVLALLILPLFRKGAAFSALVLFLLMSFPVSQARAASPADMFLNPAQQAQADYNKGDYKDAMQKFDTPYRRGVAAYKAAEYDKADQFFKSVTDPRNSYNALYNLGNAQLMQNKPEEAIASYESVLKQNSQDSKAKHNLEIAKKLLEKKQQQKKQSQQSQSKAGQQGDSEKNAQQNAQQGNKAQSDGHDQKSDENHQAQNGNQKDSQSKQQADNTKQGGGTSPQTQQPGNNEKSTNQNPDKATQDQSQNGGHKNDQDQQQAGQATQNGKSAQQQGQQQSQQQNNNDQSSSQSPDKTAQTRLRSGGKQDQLSQKQDSNFKQQPVQNVANDKTSADSNQAGLQQEPSGTDERQNSTQGKENRRMQKDVNADQWLNRIQSDPGSFLKNQFSIEDQESQSQQEANQ